MYIIIAIYIFFLAGGNAFAEQVQTVPIQIPQSSQIIQHQPSQTESPTEAPPEIPKEQEKPLPSKIKELTPHEPDLSLIEQFVSGKVLSKVTTDLRQFGYDLFKRPPSTFAPAEKVPVGPDYVVGPGDEIRVTVWGKVEGKWNVVVDRDGNIALPKVGVLGVTGLTFKELKTLLYKEFSQYYSGFDMNVSMGRLRTIQVYVVGNARKPGAYTISSLSTLMNALFEAGGPAKTGTMRNIKVKRNGKTIVSFDLYDLLLKGDKTRDIRLMPEDVIFIPPIGRVGGIAGNVKRPAIYELDKDTKITDLIEMAGGVTASGFLQRVQLERVYKNEVKIIIDKNLKELDEKSNVVLRDGDIIKIFPISPVIINAITLKGNVLRPGQYQWFKGIRVSDIIKDPEKDLLPETYFDHALIERYMPPDYHKEIIHLDLGKALFDRDVNEDKLLKPYDTLTIYSEWDFRERPKVRISGAVNKPGEFELKANMTLSDLINLAGGLKRYASLEQAELTRIHITKEGPETEKLKINLKRVLAGDPESNLKLEQDDYIFVRTVPEWRLYRTVSISGEVRFPGVYTIEKGEPLSSLIERAGGFTKDAFLKGAVLTRESARKRQQEMINEMVYRLEKELMSLGAAESTAALSAEEATIRKVEIEQKRRFIEALGSAKAKGRVVVKLLPPDKLKGTPYDIMLEDGDSIYVPEDPMMVYTAGAVYNQASFIFDKGKSISDYIKLSGGYTENADKKRVYIIKADGTAVKPSGGFLSLSWNSSENRWEVGSRDIESGDTIIVPEKLERVAWLREIKDITQILYQIAVTAGVLVVAF